MDKLKLGYFGDCSITCLISGGKRKLHCTYKDGTERVIYNNLIFELKIIINVLIQFKNGDKTLKIQFNIRMNSKVFIWKINIKYYFPN